MLPTEHFRGVHVAAEFGGHDGAAGFAVGRGDADAAEKRMQGDFHLVVGIKRLERGGVVGVVDGIEPDFLRQRSLQHRGVVGGVEGTEAGTQGAESLVAVNL